MTTTTENAVIASPAMQEVARQARLFARTSATVLLAGESGTGKEWIAKLIHEASPRAGQRYVRVNCAALPDALLESELFGHERGAFTGASDPREGRIEWAGAGTLLLDEVSELPLGLQAKLLRVLEEQEFQRLGGNESRRVEARFIATTNRVLEDQVAAGEFRSDLFYRLNVLAIQVPPLRERPDDIVPLVVHFVQRFQADATVPIRGVAKETLELLRGHAWPGNVRELRNVIHRACVVNTSGTLEPSDLPPPPQPRQLAPHRDAEFDSMRLDDIERNAILTNLRKFSGNKTEAARHLGVSSRTLSNKMKRYQQLGYVG